MPSNSERCGTCVWFARIIERGTDYRLGECQWPQPVLPYSMAFVNIERRDMAEKTSGCPVWSPVGLRRQKTVMRG